MLIMWRGCWFETESSASCSVLAAAKLQPCWEMESPWSSRGVGPAPHPISASCSPTTTDQFRRPFPPVHPTTRPPDLPITFARRCPAIVSGRATTSGRWRRGSQGPARGRRQVTEAHTSSSGTSAHLLYCYYYCKGPDPPLLEVRPEQTPCYPPNLASRARQSRKRHGSSAWPASSILRLSQV